MYSCLLNGESKVVGKYNNFTGSPVSVALHGLANLIASNLNRGLHIDIFKIAT
jgi:hypothetical protein